MFFEKMEYLIANAEHDNRVRRAKEFMATPINRSGTSGVSIDTGMSVKHFEQERDKCIESIKDYYACKLQWYNT